MNFAVVLEGVSVVYRRPRQPVASVKEYAIRWLKRHITFEEFWALNDINLEIRSGEIFGIIGANGSGKSTLLKVISRVLHPTHGRVRIRGKVAPLLELGAGFDSELTGRENVLLNGTILGHKRDWLEARLPEIVDFAGIGDFIDLPVRTYSSGMQARLGFAVATDGRPEILLVDEILGVGDAEFQKKSAERIKQIHSTGTTIMLVSHDLETIRKTCSRAAWLSQGKILAQGGVDEIIERYQKGA